MRCSSSVDSSTALIAIALAPILEKKCPPKDPDHTFDFVLIGAATFVAAAATEKDAVVDAVVDAGTTFAAAAARAAVCKLILRNILCGDLSSRVNSEEEDPRSDLRKRDTRTPPIFCLGSFFLSPESSFFLSLKKLKVFEKCDKFTTEREKEKKSLNTSFNEGEEEKEEG